jgi:hypothetical protein
MFVAVEADGVIGAHLSHIVGAPAQWQGVQGRVLHSWIEQFIMYDEVASVKDPDPGLNKWLYSLYCNGPKSATAST